MTFLQALYGSQHKEIAGRGGDGNKGRFNGNIFLSAFIIVAVVVVFMLSATLSPAFNSSINSGFHKMFGYSSGKTIGKLLAIPLLGIIYLVVTKTVGSESSFQTTVQQFYALPPEEQEKANKKILMPFFILLALMLGLALSSLG